MIIKNKLAVKPPVVELLNLVRKGWLRLNYSVFQVVGWAVCGLVGVLFS